jgi:hypothetical protein
MSLWFRVFGTNDVQPEPAALLEHLHGLDAGVRGKFSGDEQGWFRVEFVYAAEATPLTLERYLATEEGIRGELNTWAAWLETADYSPNHEALMEHMVRTTQLFTLRQPLGHSNEVLVEKLCVGTCQFLARATAGVYQADNQGFFAPDGTLLLQEY